MITLDLPKDLEQLLDRFAKDFGVSKEELALQAIRERIENLDDLATAEAALAADDGEHIPLADIIAEFGDGSDENGNSLHAAE
jgi:predicted transcriptional regulator